MRSSASGSSRSGVMKSMVSSVCMIMFLLVLLLGMIGSSQAQPTGLRLNFYQRSCPRAEDTVRQVTLRALQRDPTMGPKLLRLHYHDCFVRGCDGSILLDPVDSSNPAEKDAALNLNLAGFEVIDEIKRELEVICPGIVSCADILSLAARDAVPFPPWIVLTGRRDGRVSQSSEVDGNLPSSFSDFATLSRIFASKGLNVNDLVVLSGAHTIGTAHCVSFAQRLFNFTGRGDADPSLNPIYAQFLRSRCPNHRANPDTEVEMDPQSSRAFDTHYYTAVTQNRGLFQSDAALLTNPVSTQIVQRMRFVPNAFFTEFARSMVKMGAIDVLTGNAGEIRRQCRFVN